MRFFLVAAVCSVLLLCSCVTTATERASTEPSESAVESIKVGGEVKVRGQYLGPN